MKILKGKLTSKFRRLHAIIVECGEININTMTHTEKVSV